MKKLLILLSVVAYSKATPIHHGLPEVGTSTQFKTEDNLGNYAFGYNEDHTSGGSFRKEVGDSLGNKIGSYGLHVADGRSRVVNYVADGAGFRANVLTNEPGVDPSQDPADVTVNKAAVAAVVAPVASVVTKSAVVAPVTPVVTKSVFVAPVVAHKSILASPIVTFTPHHPFVFHAPIFLSPLK